MVDAQQESVCTLAAPNAERLARAEHKASGQVAGAWQCNQAVLHVFYEAARGAIDVVDEPVIAACVWLPLSVRCGS
jgi:hypothetical protein